MIGYHSRLARRRSREPIWASLTPGDVVNLEQSLRAGDAIGGHYVTGHIDAVGTVYSRHDDADWCTMWFRAPAAQLAQMASKGSVAVDGVSLTLVDVENDRFSVALIPHTLSVTTLGRRKVGDRVNIETDVLAKYVQSQLRPLAIHHPRGACPARETAANGLHKAFTQSVGTRNSSPMPRQTKSFLLERFREMGIRPATRHGQNFLIDLNLVELIVSPRTSRATTWYWRSAPAPAR